MRWTSIALAAALAGGVGLWLAAGADTASDAPVETAQPARASEAEPFPVETLAIRPEPLVEKIRLRGVTEAARRVDLRAETAGRVMSEPQRKGAEVAAGAALCVLEPGDRPAKLAEMRAKLVRAQADAKVSSTLSERGFAADVSVAADAAELEAARAELAAMALDIERTRITAPFAGVLETDAAELGALMQIGDQCATVIQLDPIRLVGFAPERVIEAIRLGAPAEGRLVDGRRVAAEISFIGRSADPDTRTFRIEARAPNAATAGQVRDGLTVEITLPLTERLAHRAPRQALTLDDGGRLGVQVVEEGRARFVPVRLLRDDAAAGAWIEGLEGENELIIVGQEFLSGGAPVRASPWAPGARWAQGENG